MSRGQRRAFVTAIVTTAVLIWTAVGAVGWVLSAAAAGLPDAAALDNVGAMSRATTIYDAHDRPVFTIFKEQRIEVPLARVSPHLIAAIVALEDQRFFDHGGVDVIRIAGAAWRNLRDGWGTQGGSTITQQLARQSFLTREKTLQRKLREIVLAARLERTFTKEQILELYLNKIYFGNGLYGAEAASLGYFGKHATDLDVAEAALLAGLLKGPSAYAPTVSIERALMRRRAALEAMRATGAIDDETFQDATAREIRLHDVLHRDERMGQYFKEEVRKQLVKQFGLERVYEGGLRVYTTLDLELQKAAETEVARASEELERRQKREGPQAALVALDPRTGEVKAMVGGRRFDESRFNRVTQARRQAGSAFKPFVYAAALERGYSPASQIAPLAGPIMTLEGAWVPDDHAAAGPMSMRSALRYSSNHAAVRTLQEIGIPTALRAAERFGIESVPGVWSLALGSGEVTLMAMTAAYAAFANGGIRPSPHLIRRVETAGGEVLMSAQPAGQRAVSEATAFLMTSMLSDVVNGGTGWQARRFGFRQPAAGKTGTTNDYRDAWFIGYTPHLATGVWVGYDQPRTIMRRGYAATLAVPLWGRFMAQATADHEPTPFPRPRTVTTATICSLSGKLATDACRSGYTVDAFGYQTTTSTAHTEYFTRGTEPVDYCPLHTDAPIPHVVADTLPGNGGATPAVAPLPAPVATTGVAAPAPAPAPPPPTPPPVTSAVGEAQNSPNATPGAEAQPQRRRRGVLGWLFRGGARDQNRD
jgi:1A family penicillin-binding protein